MAGPIRERAALELVNALTERVELLEASVRDAEGQLELRAQLDVLVAHEVRTPLTVILGAIETAVKLPNGDARIPDLLTMAGRHCAALSEIVDDLLSSRPGQGVVFPRAQLREVTVGAVVLQALASIGDTGRVAFVGADAPLTTAPGRLRAILANFFENADRYGRPPVVCRCERTDGGLRVSVFDRGPGLSGRDPEELFAPFVQGSSAHPDGRGMGLYLVRMLARSLGGDAHLAERPDGGTVAWVDLPQRRTDDPAARLATSPQADRRHAALAPSG